MAGRGRLWISLSGLLGHSCDLLTMARVSYHMTVSVQTVTLPVVLKLSLYACHYYPTGVITATATAEAATRPRW